MVNNKKNKTARKQRLQDRNERAQRAGSRPFPSQGEEIFVRDRVLMKKGPNEPFADRCVVKEVGSNFYSILPVDRPDRPEHRISVLPRDIVVDRCPMTFEFRKGDPVIVFHGEKFRGKFRPAVVEGLQANIGKLPSYVLRFVDDKAPATDVLPVDTTAPAIQRRRTSLRFQKGDQVIVNTKKAQGLIPSVRSSAPWIRCKVSMVDPIQGSWVYKCAFKDRSGSVCYCFVVDDTDEHIAGAQTSPIQRLLDAIQHNCRYDHLMHLVWSNGMDITSLAGSLLAAALKAANYSALLMLQDHADLDLAATIHEETGDGILHRIAKTPHAERFFQEAAEYARQKDISKIDLNAKHGKSLFRHKNHQGRIFLFDMIESKNLRAVELVLSDHDGLPLDISVGLGDPYVPLHVTWVDNNGVSLRDVAEQHEQWEMICLMDLFDVSKASLAISGELVPDDFRYRESAEYNEIIQKAADSIQADIGTMARRLYRGWRNVSCTDVVISHHSRQGNLPVVKWLVEAIPELIHSQRKGDCVDVSDCLEYVQLEVCESIKPSLKDRRNDKYLGLVSRAALGSGPCLKSEFALRRESQLEYADFLAGLPAKVKEGERLDFLRELEQRIMLICQDRLSTVCLDYFSFKKSRLTDDKNLPERLATLDYLVSEKAQAPPHALDAIQWRQGGVLRWLVENSILDLEEPAARSHLVTRRVGDSLQVLGNTKIAKLPMRVSVAELLLFACVEYDDLQSFLWILDSGKLNGGQVYLQGWNLVHALAFFGRAEIFLTLQGILSKSSLVEPCHRKPLDGLLCAHIAISEGFTALAGFMLAAGCPSKTKKGQDVYELARASRQPHVHNWGVSQGQPALLGTAQPHTVQQLLSCLRRLQALFRGQKVRQRWASELRQYSEFASVWGSVIYFQQQQDESKWWTWTRLRESEADLARAEELGADLNQINASADKLGKTLAAALQGRPEEEEDIYPVGADEQPEVGPLEDDRETIAVSERLVDLDRIQLTKDVVKWLRVSDPKYCRFFLRRIKQLAAGDRSRILAKSLTGCKTQIFETYLEQKSGFRILWTMMPDNNLRIWYVAKHDDVSRRIKLIDDAENRSSRQLAQASAIEDFESNGDDTSWIMLDPLGNTPMKLYEVTFDNVDRLAEKDWSPPLFLTNEEREIVETTGTVLVLGRSGTGKTVCICNRMDYDWRRLETDLTFTQLFVARSAKLRNLVKQTVDGFVGQQACRRKFLTFPSLVRTLEQKLADTGREYLPLYEPGQKMTFLRFKTEVFSPENSSVGALLVWKIIRTFLKGSAESLLHEGGLPESNFLNLGRRQCRLSPSQREGVYQIFTKYKAYMKEKNLWDDCDRIRCLVERIKHVITENSEDFNTIRESKIYVDEIQDYTQAEILLFFVLSGPDSLFLAGDPAQSVVDGADFQFKDIRSVGYHLFGSERRDLIPDKPKTVSLNFRSHSGILKVAAAVLDILFHCFPDSATLLKKDRSLFRGPRPGLLYEVNPDRLLELSQKVEGITFLTHDENVPALRQTLQGYPLVFGIREAKGLEWQSVVIVDFFVGLPETYQKAWRDLLLGRNLDDLSRRFPEMESHLKLLYTGITRCMQRLFFAELSRSISGGAFVRWAATTTISTWTRTEALAVEQGVDNVESMSRTVDEWRAAGMENAAMAEQEAVEPEEAKAWLDKALYCFDKSGDSVTAGRVRTHLEGVHFWLDLEGKNESSVAMAGLEVEAADIVKRLLEEGLVLEARRLFMVTMPLLSAYSQEQLQTRVVDKLPAPEALEESMAACSG